MSRAGDLGVAYDFVGSPMGTLLVAATPRGLVRLAYEDEDPDRVLQELAEDVSPDVEASPSALAATRRELEEYFDGRRREFVTPLDLAGLGGFIARVLEATRRIPFGAVATYGEVARMAGSPRAARAAGNALNANPVPVVVPCHRVVPRTGGIGGYGGREDRKAFLLELEGRG